MGIDAALDPATRESLIRQGWYAHDARWYAAAMSEFGVEAANRLNRAAVRATAVVEARRLARALGRERAEDVPAFIEMMAAGRDLYVGAALIDLQIWPIDPESYEVTVGDCFAHANVTKAGIADAYECAVFDRFQGWHEALALPLAPGQFPPARCARAEGRECRRVLRIAPAGGTEP